MELLVSLRLPFVDHNCLKQLPNNPNSCFRIVYKPELVFRPLFIYALTLYGTIIFLKEKKTGHGFYNNQLSFQPNP